MTEKILTELNISTYQHTDMEDVIHIGKECGVIRSWNNPKLDIQRKVKTQNDYFLSLNSQTELLLLRCLVMMDTENG